jgi:small-conductance mechanosensitive channel
LLLTAAVLVAVITAGIDLTALTVFGGALGVGLGLGLQRVVSSFVSGFILVFENSLRPGDMITVGETFGVVRSLNARYVAVTTPDGLDILIPNEELTSSRLTSWCYEDRRVRVRVSVQISYDDDPERAMTILSEIAQAHRRVLSDPRPETAIIAFADSGIQLELAVWLEDPTQGLKDVRSDLYLQIWQRFKAARISIPYPHRQLVVSEATSAALAPRYAEK